jgi:hypothetical protein
LKTKCMAKKVVLVGRNRPNRGAKCVRRTFCELPWYYLHKLQTAASSGFNASLGPT